MKSPPLSRLSLLLVLSALFLAACVPPVLPATDSDAETEATPVPAEPDEPAPTEAVSAAAPTPVVMHSLPTVTNVRGGPNTEYPVVFRVDTGTALTAIGRSADGDWLQVEFEDQTGWIYGPLTDIAPDVRMALPVTEPVAESVKTPVPAPEAESDPPVKDPASQVDTDDGDAIDTEPQPDPAATPDPAADTLLVTGTTVNLRGGPGTAYPIVGQVRRGDRLTATGRNADGTWLQVADPNDPAGRAWIYGPLTGLDSGAAMAGLEAMAAPAPAPTEMPVPEPQPTPVPAVQLAQPVLSATCSRQHTVNPNEKHLAQITDWYGLDLAAVAALNGLDPEAPLTAGAVICLSDASAPIPAPPADTPSSGAHTPQDSPGLPFNPISIAAGRGFTCVVQADSTLSCWGDNREGQASPPAGAFQQVTAGLHNGFACGLRDNGTAVCWGDISQPPNLDERFTEIGSGGSYTCGLRTDGYLTCWGGGNRYGQATPPREQFKTMGTGGVHVCAIRMDDTTACWGNNSKGESSPPPGAFRQISNGAGYSCAIRMDGTLACWGDATRKGIAPPTSGTFTMLDAGNLHACAVRTDGIVTCWGSDSSGGRHLPPGGLFQSVASGQYHTCGVRTDGAMVCWGSQPQR